MVSPGRVRDGTRPHDILTGTGLAPRALPAPSSSPPHRLCPQRDLERLGPLPRSTVLRSPGPVCCLPWQAVSGSRRAGARGVGARRGEGPPLSPEWGGTGRLQGPGAASCCPCWAVGQRAAEPSERPPRSQAQGHPPSACGPRAHSAGYPGGSLPFPPLLLCAPAQPPCAVPPQCEGRQSWAVQLSAPVPTSCHPTGCGTPGLPCLAPSPQSTQTLIHW